jgi:hypothetical protein
VRKGQITTHLLNAASFWAQHQAKYKHFGFIRSFPIAAPDGSSHPY